MKNLFLLALTFFTFTSLFAADDEFSDLMSIQVSDVEDLLNHESGSLANLEGLPSAFVNRCVNVITGSYCENEVDLDLDGPIPFALERSYCSDNHLNGSLFHGWNHNFGGILLMQRGSRHRYVITKGRAGGEFVYLNRKENRFLRLDPELLKKGVTNCRETTISGRSNLKNNRLHYIDKYFQLKTGSGAIHHYYGGSNINNEWIPTFLLAKSELPSTQKIVYPFTVNEYVMPSINQKIRSVELHNTSDQKISFFNFEYPSDEKLKAYAKAKKEDRKVDFPTIKVSTKDSREVIYTLDVAWGHGHKKKLIDNSRFVIIRAQRSCAPEVNYEYSLPESHNLEKIVRKNLPEGRFLEIDYYNNSSSFKHDKVKSLKAPLGATSQAEEMFTFDYHKNGDIAWTTVKDAKQHLTVFSYHLSTLRLDAIQKYQGKKNYQLYSTERYYWGRNNDHANLIAKTLEDAKNNILYCRYFTYDIAGNVLSERFYGNLTGENKTPFQFDHSRLAPADNECEFYEKKYRYSSDLNLIIYKKEGKVVWKYHYKPGTSLLIAKELIAGSVVKQREFFDYDANGALIEKIVDDGHTPYDEKSKLHLNDVTERRITRITNSQKPIHIGLPEIVEEYYLDIDTKKEKLLRKTINHYGAWRGRIRKKEIFDSSNQLKYTLEWTYNDYGQIIEEVNAIGEKIIRRFDLNGNLKYEEGPEPSHYKEYEYDDSNRLRKITEHADEKSFEQIFDYNLLGQKISSKDIYGNETTYKYDALGRLIKIVYPKVCDDSGELKNSVEKHSYDEFGNLITITNPRGFTTKTKYTIRSDPYEKYYPDGTMEKYTYSLKGELIRYVDRDGTITEYKNYDYKSRPQKIEVYSRKKSLLARTIKKYSTFHLEKEIDANGHETLYSYDGAGRLIRVQKENQLTTYTYDSLDRQSEKHEYFGTAVNEYLNTLTEYDNLDRKIKEVLQDSSGTTLNLVEYNYDSKGNRKLIRTHNQTGKAEKSIKYNFQNKPVEIIDALKHATQITYRYNFVDAHGICVPYSETKDALGNVAIIIKDAMGRIVLQEKRNPNGQTTQKTEYFYDLASNKTKQIDTVLSSNKPDHFITTLFKYDCMNRLETIVEAEGTAEQKLSKRTYTSTGKLDILEKPNKVTIKYVYDGLGRLLSYQASDGSLHYSFDYKMERYPQVFVKDHVYQTTSRLKFDPNEHLIEETLMNGLTMRYQYDRLGRLICLTYPDKSSLHTVYQGNYIKELQRRDILDNILYKHVYNEYDLSG